MNFWENKKIDDIVTTRVVSVDKKGLIVKPEGCEIELMIKKSQIAMSAGDARPSRFVGGERIDAAILDLNFEKIPSFSGSLFCQTRITPSSG